MENYEWAKEMNCAVTVCDAEGIIIYQNDKAVETYKKHGNLIGKNLYECHSERSKEIIRHLLATGGSNAYTIETGRSQSDLPDCMEEGRQGCRHRGNLHDNTSRYASLCERITFLFKIK